MARDLEHLQLPVWQRPLPRRRKAAGRQPGRDRRVHGQQLLTETEEMVNRLQLRRQGAPAGINPKFIFKLQLNPKGMLDDEKLAQMGLRLLAKDANRAIVVFPDEATLRELRRRIEEYSGLVAGGHRYHELASIDAISELTAEDRTGQRLAARPLGDGETAPLDVELWHSGDREECRARVREVEVYLQSLGLVVTDSWIGESVCLVRARLNGEALAELLNTDYVKEIDRRPEPAFEMLDVVRLDLGQLDVAAPAREDLVGVLVVDSGVMQRHPLLGPALGDAQVFPDALRQRIIGGAEDGDERQGGHGTAVAGIAVYNDVGQCIGERRFEASARLFSARVTDDENQFDEDELVEHQLEGAVEHFLANYATVKVINISLGDETMVSADGRYQFRLAAAIDELAYRYRDREIIFVVSAGNYFPQDLNAEDIRRQYPTYLLDAAARVINPATAALAVTVGGVSYGAGRLQNRGQRDTDSLVAGERGWPSPFTRTGWGIGGSVKPDFVDFAGDLRFERGRIPNVAAHAGVPSTAKDFAPPNGRLFRTVAGTSFAAPRVANLAAQLFREFPGASSNLIRALIASSARIPDSRPEQFANGDPWDEEILRVYGYGQPNFEQARWSAQNSVLLVEDSTIDLDAFQLFTIPSLPEEFLTTRGDRHLSICLAFDPPTRHTRADYFGLGVEFAMFRNTSHDAIADAIRAWSAEEKEVEEDVPNLGNIRTEGELPIKVTLRPGVRTRKRSTLQRATLRVGSSGWQYDGGPLILAVICQRKWAPAEITSQRFAVVVAVEHEDPSVDVYEHVRQQTRVYQRVRVQV